jgi:hypothetical protein
MSGVAGVGVFTSDQGRMETEISTEMKPKAEPSDKVATPNIPISPEPIADL